MSGRRHRRTPTWPGREPHRARVAPIPTRCRGRPVPMTAHRRGRTDPILAYRRGPAAPILAPQRGRAAPILTHRRGRKPSILAHHRRRRPPLDQSLLGPEAPSPGCRQAGRPHRPARPPRPDRAAAWRAPRDRPECPAHAAPQLRHRQRRRLPRRPSLAPPAGQGLPGWSVPPPSGRRRGATRARQRQGRPPSPTSPAAEQGWLRRLARRPRESHQAHPLGHQP